MATVRDPAFWRRFSVAVHLDEEATAPTPTKTLSNTVSCPTLNPTESWLAQQHRKKRRNRYMLCMSLMLFTTLVAIVVVALVWLSRHGWFMHGEKLSW